MHYGPGSYILLHRHGRPPWPALVCNDDMAPRKVLQKRPHGFYTLVLLIKEKPELQVNVYATTAEMFEFDPFGSAAPHVDLDLKRAYDAVLNKMDSPGSTLYHWRHIIEGQRDPGSEFFPSPSPSHDSEEDSDDEELKAAKELSLREWKASTKRKPGGILLPSPTSEKSLPIPSPASEKIHLTPSSRNERIHLAPFPAREEKRLKRARAIYNSATTRASNDIRNHFQPVEDNCSDNCNESGAKRHKFDNADVVEEDDILKSRQFVTFYIGEKGEPFSVPDTEVQKIPSLSDPSIGVQTYLDDGTKCIKHPALREFDPVDFALVAEFLSTGGFGHRHIDDDNHDEFIEHCAAAWKIADRLGIHHLLDHIAEKVKQALPWGSFYALGLADLVYETFGTPLEAYEVMKDQIVDYVATHFYEMVQELGDLFKDRIRGLPELELSVLTKMTEGASERFAAAN